MKKGFSLVEMLVVIGIITVLVGASIAGYAKMTKTADRAKAQELVSNAATALTAYFQTEGCWPKRLLEAEKGFDGGSMLTAEAAYPLAKGKYMSITTEDGKCAGFDKFGVLTHWGVAIMKRKGDKAIKDDVSNHILRFAIDDDGDGVIKGAQVGGEKINIRATAAVWCCDKDGKFESYQSGRRGGGVYSWTYGQTRNVN